MALLQMLVVMLLSGEALVPSTGPAMGRTTAVCGRKRKEPTDEEAPAPLTAKQAARLAAESLGPDVETKEKTHHHQRSSKRKPKDDTKDVPAPTTKERREVKPWEEMGIAARLKLRGVAAAESAAAAAEMAAAAAALEDDYHTGNPYYTLDASETAAVTAWNVSTWPTAYLVGIEVTSRKAAAKMRTRGISGKVLEAAAMTAEWSVDDSLSELSRLCETARLRVVNSTSQRLERANGATMVGKGKLAQVAASIKEHDVDAVVFDDELTFSQQRNIMGELADHGCDPARLQVLDRTQLVLQIFSERARTREAKTQVALARAEYMLPRLATFMTTGAGMELRGGSAGDGGSSGGGAGAYLRGAGESQLEMDRRLFTKKIQRLKNDLEDVAAKRLASRKRKLEQADDLPLVAIVGYTNAGKTSLLNALSETTEALYADDRLFATLDPTTRRVALPGGRACKLTDTVGFLQKLPTRLIASFRATLEEITDASLLVHVVDSSSVLAQRHVAAVNAIVAELGCADIPQIRVLNKLDKSSDEDDDHTTALSIGARVVARTSATRGDGIEELLEHIEATLSAMNAPVHVLVPFTEGGLLNMIYTKGTILDLEHLDEGTKIKARVPEALRAKLQPFSIN